MLLGQKGKPLSIASLDSFLHIGGFEGLGTPGVVQGIAKKVTDHEHFRQLLTRWEPSERQIIYETLRPHLKFRPLPLDVYLAKSADLAERKQLPSYDAATGVLKEYAPPEVGLKATASTAILEDIHRQSGRRLTVACVKCTTVAEYSGTTLVDATIKARKDGWVYSEVNGKPQETCKRCHV